MARLLTRRNFIVGAAAASLLAGCESRPAAGFLAAMKTVNEKFEGFVFSPKRLAPELPPSAETPENAFPSYFISNSMPFPPSNWTLRVGGLVRKTAVFTLAELQRMPRTEMRVQRKFPAG